MKKTNVIVEESTDPVEKIQIFFFDEVVQIIFSRLNFPLNR